MNGKYISGALVLSGLIAGAAMYYLQIYGYYRTVAFQPGDLTLVPLGGGPPEPMLADGVTGIDADSSPLRFRACFTTPTSLATLTETYQIYDGATPLTAPGWFDCYDAGTIDSALESGEAVAFLSAPGVATGVDRVVAVFADGRAFAWHQLTPGAED